MQLSLSTVLTLAFSVANAWPTWLALRALAGELVQRNQWCNGTDDSPFDWGLCTNDCQYKTKISGCSLQDWICIDKCYDGCSDKYCHGGEPDGTGGPWKQ